MGDDSLDIESRIDQLNKLIPDLRWALYSVSLPSGKRKYWVRVYEHKLPTLSKKDDAYTAISAVIQQLQTFKNT